MAGPDRLAQLKAAIVFPSTVFGYIPPSYKTNISSPAPLTRLLELSTSSSPVSSLSNELSKFPDDFPELNNVVAIEVIRDNIGLLQIANVNKKTGRVAVILLDHLKFLEPYDPYRGWWVALGVVLVGLSLALFY